MRKWDRVSEWCIRSGPWRIAKAIVEGNPSYLLTHDGKTRRWRGVTTHKTLGVFGTAQEAMEAAK